MNVSEVMTAQVVTATPRSTISEVARTMAKIESGAVPVTDDGKVVGLITDRDIVIRAVSEGKDCSSVRAEDIMSVDIHTVNPNDRVVDVIRKMGDKQVRRIPVVNENKYLVGMISMADVAVETREDRELAEALEDISKGSSFWNRIFG